MRKPEYVASAYHELPDGDGVMRVEEGSVLVSDNGLPAGAYPPEAFAEAFPDVDPATLPRSRDGKSVDAEPEA